MSIVRLVKCNAKACDRSYVIPPTIAVKDARHAMSEIGWTSVPPEDFCPECNRLLGSGVEIKVVAP